MKFNLGIDYIQCEEVPGLGWTLRARENAGLDIPVPVFQPTTSNKSIAVDLQPSGPNPVEFGGSGYSWIDCCDADLRLNPSAPVQCAYIGMRSDYAFVCSRGFNGAFAKPLALGYGNIPMWAINYNGVFYPIADATYQIGSNTNRVTTIFTVNGVVQSCDGREKEVIGDIEERVIRAVKRVKVQAFRWKNNNDKRIYFGPLAQDIEREFSAEGLDAADYGLFERGDDGHLSINIAQFNILRNEAV